MRPIPFDPVPRRRRAWLAVTLPTLAAALALSLAACGGGGADTAPRANVTRVVVMGDSLADAGTFGIRFTIQGNDIYPERVATTYGLAKGCNFFAFNGTTFVANPTPGCSNFAIGGGVINPASSAFSMADPRGIGVQFTTATAAGNFGGGDLLVVDGGGNDAAALVGVFVRAGQPAPAGDGGASLFALLGTLLTPAQLTAAQTGGQAGLALAGGQYMTALADNFFNTIKTGALDKGAQRVVVINIPGITNTPRFQAVLNGIAAASGGGTAGATARAQSEALFKSWVEAFNRQIASRFAGEARVVVVDLYTEFNNQVANPTQFGLTNVKDTACPATGVGADGLPTYTFATCTNAALAATPPPAGATGGADWYKTWAFSDGFHPTGYGHQLVAQLIARSLAQAGWL